MPNPPGWPQFPGICMNCSVCGNPIATERQFNEHFARNGYCTKVSSGATLKTIAQELVGSGAQSGSGAVAAVVHSVTYKGKSWALGTCSTCKKEKTMISPAVSAKIAAATLQVTTPNMCRFCIRMLGEEVLKVADQMHIAHAGGSFVNPAKT